MTRRGERVNPSDYLDLHSSELSSVADLICDYVEAIRTRLDLVSHGVAVVAYDKFEALAPETIVEQDGRVSQYRLKSAIVPSSEEARFCYDFAVDSLLALRDIQMPVRVQQSSRPIRVRVKTPCALIVHPKSDPPEVIREAAVSEDLLLARRLYRTIYPP